MNFESNNPRTSDLKNPFFINDPLYKNDYQKMVMKSSYPAGFENGLYHLTIGIWVCVFGFFILGIVGAANYRWAIIIAGAVVATLCSVLYSRYMQRKSLFPRGASMTQSKNARPVFWILPVVFLIGYPVYAVYTHNPLYLQICTGCFFALLEVVSYAKTSRTSLLFAALVLLFIPFLTAYMGMYSSDNPVLNVTSVVPYEGMVFVAIGLWLSAKSMTPNPFRHNREKLGEFLNSNDPQKQFNALSFLCSSIDPSFIPQILKLCQSKTRIVAYTAQIALGNMWGPKPAELYAQQPGQAISMNPNVPEEYKKQFEEQLQARQNAVRERWLAHYKMVEDELQKIAQTEDEVQDNFFAIVGGNNLYHKQAQIVAIEMIGTMRTPKAYSTLMKILLLKDKDLSIAAMKGFFGADSKAVLYLEKFFVATSSWMRRRAIRGARYMLDYLTIFDEEEADVARALLQNDIEGLFDSKDTPTFAATICLLPGQTPDDIDLIEQYAENPRPLIKVEALCTLSRVAPEKAEDWVVPALNDPSAAVRYGALKCVCKLRLKQSMDIFSRMQNDRCQKVAVLAAGCKRQLEVVTMAQRPWF